MSRAAWLAALVLIGSVAGHAQSPSARFSISVAVQDQTDAAIVGARAKLRSAVTAGAQSTTNEIDLSWRNHH